MDLETLQNQVDVDLKIDDTELDLESIRTPQLHNKYLKLFTKYSLQYKKAKDDYDGLYKFKWEYYTGKSTMEVYQAEPFDLKVLKSDVGIYLNADEELQKLGQRTEYLNVVVVYIERVLKEINNRNWNIRNTIEWKKFLHGE
tara:strand:- start:343 stop:768 length:426 start_codon:yes stop_codon:yes gene_type:complete